MIVINRPMLIYAHHWKGGKNEVPQVWLSIPGIKDRASDYRRHTNGVLNIWMPDGKQVDVWPGHWILWYPAEGTLISCSNAYFKEAFVIPRYED